MANRFSDLAPGALTKRVAQLWLLVLSLAASPASAMTVMVLNANDTAAQIAVNGGPPQVIQLGEISPEGVKLVDVKEGVTVLRINGQMHRIPIGSSNLSEVVVRLGPDGGYRTTAIINKIAFPAIIDTGASVVSLTTVHAKQLGIDYLNGRKGVAQTANGPVDIYIVTIPSVQVGGIVLTNVLGSVIVGSQAATLKEVLIGNSFLRQVQMLRSGDLLVLRRGGSK